MFALGALVMTLVISCSDVRAVGDDRFVESLAIRPLPGEFVHSEFKFEIRSDRVFRADAWNHFDLFPRALGEILLKTSAAEVHLSLTRGLWRTKEWGYTSRPSPPGAQLWVWFQQEVNASSIDKKWTELSDALAGLMCGSLRAVTRDTLIPQLAFRPKSYGPFGSLGSETHVRYFSLPRETVCTENLTPWAKLLPCDVKAGLGSLLHAGNLFESAYHSLAVDFRHVLNENNEPALDLVFTLTVVHSPAMITGKMEKAWSLKKLFGAVVTSSCGVAASSSILVDSDSDPMGKFALVPGPTRVELIRGKKVAVYDVSALSNASSDSNVRAVYEVPLDLDLTRNVDPPPLTARRYVVGYGLERGGVKTELVYSGARRGQDLDVVYMQYFPWYIRVYLHTMKLTVNGYPVEPERLVFTPGRDRERPFMLELGVKIPPGGKCVIEVGFDRALLKWTEYPPDANHGFYIPAGVVYARMPTSSFAPPNFPVGSMIPLSWFEDGVEDVELAIYTETLLVSLPTPDFSMPYNVICLACTVVALAFGPLHNITTKRLAIVTSEKKRASVLQRLKAFVFRAKTVPEVAEVAGNEGGGRAETDKTAGAVGSAPDEALSVGGERNGSRDEAEKESDVAGEDARPE